MAEIAPFKSAEQKVAEDRRDREIKELKGFINTLQEELIDMETVSGTFSAWFKEVETERDMLLADSEHDRQRILFLQKENEYLKWKYKEAMRWRNEGAD